MAVDCLHWYWPRSLTSTHSILRRMILVRLKGGKMKEITSLSGGVPEVGE